jgi:tripartite-type tricarboxylate transporter receptor subunit TctC
MNKRVMACLILVASIAGSCAQAFAQDKSFPNRRVTLVVPIAAGGGGDAVARAIADGLSKEIGFPVIVENKPGGNGVLAATAVATSPPDGHTVLLGFSGLAQNAALRKDIKDVLPLLDPVGQLVSSGFAFAVSPSLNVSTLEGLVQQAKSTNSEITYGTNGVGSTQHLDGQIFGRQAGIRMLHVPFKGGEVESLSAVMAGTIQGAFGSPGIFRAYQESGKVKILAVSGTKRSPALRDVPTFSELGYVDIDIVGWVGAFVSKGTPGADIGRLNEALRRALSSASVRDRIGVVGFNVDVTSASDFRRQIGSEIVRWGVLAKDVKLD